MLDRHAVQEMVRAGLPLKPVARQFGVSRRTIRRITHEAPVTTLTPADRVGRPPVDEAVRQRIGALLTAPSPTCRRGRSGGASKRTRPRSA